MILNLQEVARAIQAAGAVQSIPVTGWSVDTRTQSAGDLYFALRGPHHDGHDYVAAAIEKAAAGVVVAAGREIPPQALGRQLEVADTLRALQVLGSWARRRWGGTVVGVTGSAGKTTTKDAIAHLLQVELGGADGAETSTIMWECRSQFCRFQTSAGWRCWRWG